MYLTDAIQERNFSDLKRWSNGLIGKVFYRLDPKDSKRYQTVRMGWNGFANKITPQFTNFVEGTPPPNIPALPPLLLGSLQRYQPHTQEFH